MQSMMERLQYKISPLEDKDFTATLKYAMKDADMRQFLKHRDGRSYYRVTAKELWMACFGENPSVQEATILGRSLQAMLWERSASKGLRVFIKSKEEYEYDGF